MRSVGGGLAPWARGSRSRSRGAGSTRLPACAGLLDRSPQPRTRSEARSALRPPPRPWASRRGGRGSRELHLCPTRTRQGAPRCRDQIPDLCHLDPSSLPPRPLAPVVPMDLVGPPAERPRGSEREKRRGRLPPRQRHAVVEGRLPHITPLRARPFHGGGPPLFGRSLSRGRVPLTRDPAQPSLTLPDAP